MLWQRTYDWELLSWRLVQPKTMESEEETDAFSEAAISVLLQHSSQFARFLQVVVCARSAVVTFLFPHVTKTAALHCPPKMIDCHSLCYPFLPNKKHTRARSSLFDQLDTPLPPITVVVWNLERQLQAASRTKCPCTVTPLRNL